MATEIKNEANLDLFNKFETIDFETGELVNVLDSSLPIQNRLDPAKWLLDRFTAEIELCKDRKQLWNDREITFKLGIDKIREAIRDSMLHEGTDKIKTNENTAFLTSKDIVSFDESLIKPEHKLYDLTLKDITFARYQNLMGYAKASNIQTSEKVKPEPKLMPAELVSVTKQATLTIRKSPKS